MSFFDKKEDVLDFQLTAYGKYLLSQGRLKPAYYAFYDDDILYDRDRAQQGGSAATEVQSATDRRIKYETPSHKAQANRSGAATRTNKFLGQVIAEHHGCAATVSENSAAFLEAFQLAPFPFADQTSDISIAPIGTSDLKTDFAPAWHIGCLSNTLSSSQNYYVNNLTASNVNLADGFVSNIPQLDIEIDYQTFYSIADSPVELGQKINKITQDLNINGVALYVKENYLLLEIQEKNVLSEKENFDIEVYAADEHGTETSLHQIPFKPFPGATNISPVDKFMNVAVDNEIPQSILKEARILELVGTKSGARLNLGRDLYDAVEAEAEPCDD